MPAIYRASLRTARLTLVRDDVDSGPAAGTMEICSAGYAAVLAIFTLNDPSGSISGDVLTFSGMPKASVAAATGTAALARVKNSTGTVIINGLTVGVAASDVLISPSTSIASGQPVNLLSALITHPS